ncbi:MAG: AzlC family ABC transporter permease [Coriobacteriia bacterium]
MSAPAQSLGSPSTPRQRLSRGARLGLPILLGYAPVGAAYGVLATSYGLTAWQAVASSATALAGAGQFIGLSLMHAAAPVVAVITATTVVNLRYVLFGATLAPHLRRTPLAGQAALAFSMTDETFAVNIDDLRRGFGDPWTMAGVGAIAWLGWVAGTAVGALGGSLVGDPSRWGVDFAMPAMFTALLVGQAEDRKRVLAGVLAAVLAIVLAGVLPGTWYIVVATLATATVATVIDR